ncbi:hypothetical protein DAPPUDRAFT_222740 [Daphnia pulex]|uniref:CS domain-containing protein n=1 Tax=Daphnia pulex TaxID=6669 RepID=E9G5V8_DAPPU|nr:hypothetical protein DAPPUDRAFT_222740 [Daphnia pulex]|eukprot:EFX85104.1 hypothetical protein DAPPUDRAFT_222740 [Daphnia pulex]
MQIFFFSFTMGNNKHDQLFLEILKEDRSIVTFLDSVFGFLYRCTDFYQHQNDSQKIGFPAGVANEVVQKMFLRYEKQTQYEKQAAILGNIASSNSNIPSACQEVVVSDNADMDVQSTVESKGEGAVEGQTLKSEEKDCSEIYNGDDRGNYRWSQTIHDIDVFIPVKKDIRKAKQLKVKIDSLHLKVETLQPNGSCILIDHTFPHKVKPDECLWSLVGEHVQVNLEKKEEQWWDRLFSSDPPIDTKKIDTVVMASELSQEEHMKIEELMVNQEKRQQFSSAI